jgi:hypothetical protein
MNSDDFSRFRHESAHELMRLNDVCAKSFRISFWPRWDYDLARGTLTFSKDDFPRVIASILVVGTSSNSAGTWLWSWANGYLPDNVSEPLKKVREFGLAENLRNLTEPYATDDEQFCWDMTAIAARLMDAKGAYRCPSDNGYIYLIFTDIAYADWPKQIPGKNRLDCQTHGAAYATYVCEHLTSNPAQEWLSEEPDSENQWPDAWCKACDAFFRQEGEWNEANQENAKMRLVCHYCYETARSKARPRAGSA